MTEVEGWRPVLEGDLAERALGAARAIGDAIAAAFRADGASPARGDASLSRGWTGTAVTMHYLDRAFPDAGFGEVRAAALDRAAEAVAAQPMNVGLMQGFPGVAWAIEHLGENTGAEDGNAAIDDALLAMSGAAAWNGLYDLVSGLVGVGLYALERVTTPSGRKLLELVVDALDESAETHETGITWYTKPELIPPSARERVPEGYYNLGLAHGVPGVVGLLAGAHRAGVARDRTQRLLEGSVPWVLAQALPPGGRATWPYFVGPGIDPQPARLAWCYGDAGVITVLLMAAEATGRAEWETAALEALERAAARPPGDSDVQGASLCHGSMGLAHLWNRIWQRHPSETLRRSIEHWTTVALAQRVQAGGFAGYSVWRPEHDDEGGDIQGPGLLAGASGIALALVAAATPHAPAWDRHLLLSHVA
ncbi:MAG TPA: lanthionine synthetase C family protein [Actinomycetota bacterium]|nr:lanthionine synthetase C family protein [Actinomycetota bacterium]